jgi:hypothetical protein
MRLDEAILTLARVAAPRTAISAEAGRHSGWRRKNRLAQLHCLGGAENRSAPQSQARSIFGPKLSQDYLDISVGTTS